MRLQSESATTRNQIAQAKPARQSVEHKHWPVKLHHVSLMQLGCLCFGKSMLQISSGQSRMCARSNCKCQSADLGHLNFSVPNAKYSLPEHCIFQTCKEHRYPKNQAFRSGCNFLVWPRPEHRFCIRRQRHQIDLFDLPFKPWSIYTSTWNNWTLNLILQG